MILKLGISDTESLNTCLKFPMKNFQHHTPEEAEPVILLISRQQVEENNMSSVLEMLRILTASREDIWRYRQQMSLVVDGYQTDPRELVDIVQVRSFLREFAMQWPYWSFFFTHDDISIILLASCCCGSEYPGGGRVAIDYKKLQMFLTQGFNALNLLFEKHGFSEIPLESHCKSLLAVIEKASS